MDNNEQFFEELKGLDEYLEATDNPTRNQNDPNDDAGHSNPETRDHGIEINNSLDFSRNFSTSIFSRETRVASNRPTQFSTPGFGHNQGISTSDSLVYGQHSVAEASEEIRTSSFPVPDVPSVGGFSQTDSNRSNLSEPLSSGNYYDMNNMLLEQQKEYKNASFGADTSSYRKKENKETGLFPERRLIDLDSISPHQMPTGREGNEATAQTAKDYRELSSAAAIFSPIEDSSNIGITIERTATGSVADAEEVSLTELSRILTLSQSPRMAKPFKCDVCVKTFRFKCNLKRHSSIHTVYKSFVCKTCGKIYKHQSTLRNHLWTHSDDKRHTCHYCEKNFRLKSILDAHIRTHTQEKPFACEICSKKFAQKRYLGPHLLTHTGDKPYKCEECGSGFASKRNCIQHQKREHP